jgi:mannose-6-phosphate isomerase-like protein (cupin superfamily)
VIVIPAGVPHLIHNPAATPARYLDADIVATTAYAKLDPGG